MAPSLRSLALPLAKTLPRSFRAKPHPDPERVTLSPKVCLAQPRWDWEEELQWDSHSRDGRGQSQWRWQRTQLQPQAPVSCSTCSTHSTHSTHPLC